MHHTHKPGDTMRIFTTLVVTCFIMLSALPSAQAAKNVTLDDFELSIRGELSEEKIYLNGKEIFSNPDEEYELDIINIFYLNPPEIEGLLTGFLVQTTHEGRGCYNQYRLVFVDPEGAAQVTDEFSTCNYVREVRVLEDEVHVILYTGPSINEETVTFIYKDGEITEHEQEPAE